MPFRHLWCEWIRYLSYWVRRLRFAGTYGMPLFEPALLIVIVFCLASPLAKDSPSIVTLRAIRAREFADQLRAAMVHELGHVWIYTHHSFLQTERLANVIGLRVADRASFEKVYAKLWKYERASGVPIDDLLGPPLAGHTLKHQS
jgi:hypothetical protein